MKQKKILMEHVMSMHARLFRVSSVFGGCVPDNNCLGDDNTSGSSNYVWMDSMNTENHITAFTGQQGKVR